jgi:hypothetical protein
MKSSAECSRQQLAALVIVTSLLSACATVSSEPFAGGCPPVVEYSQAEQAQAADEVAALPEDSVVIDWLADYSALRDQVRLCRA